MLVALCGALLVCAAWLWVQGCAIAAMDARLDAMQRRVNFVDSRGMEDHATLADVAQKMRSIGLAFENDDPDDPEWDEVFNDLEEPVVFEPLEGRDLPLDEPDRSLDDLFSIG
jgi:hypothetical protein